MTDAEFLANYFVLIGKIWAEFQAKKISMTEREAVLRVYRARLFSLRK